MDENAELRIPVTITTRNPKHTQKYNRSSVFFLHGWHESYSIASFFSTRRAVLVTAHNDRARTARDLQSHQYGDDSDDDDRDDAAVITYGTRNLNIVKMISSRLTADASTYTC